MARYRLSAEAEDDLVAIHQYGVREWGAPQADRYYWQLIAHLKALGDNPFLYMPVDHIRPGYRRSVCARHAIYYRVTGEVVEIMAILRAQDVEPRL